MKKTQHSSALLVEILIAVLFFGLACTILLNVYGVTNAQSRRAGASADALTQAQSLADELYMADDPSAFLTQAGYTDEGSCWTLEQSDYTISVSLSETPYPAGTMRDQCITVTYAGEKLLELPCSRYIGTEVHA